MLENQTKDPPREPMAFRVYPQLKKAIKERALAEGVTVQDLLTRMITAGLVADARLPEEAS